MRRFNISGYDFHNKLSDIQKLEHIVENIDKALYISVNGNSADDSLDIYESNWIFEQLVDSIKSKCQELIKDYNSDKDLWG